MRIPRKITPDGLTDAVITLQYVAAEATAEEVGKQVEQVMHEQGFQQLPSSTAEEAEAPSATVTFYTEGGLVIGSRLGQLGFNGVPVADGPFAKVGRYIGWAAYRQLLTNVLTPLLANKTIRKWSSVTVRYINVLPWQPVTEQLRVAPVFPMPAGLTVTPALDYRLTWPVTEEGFRVRLRLNDQAMRPGETDTRGTLFDVEVTLQRTGADFASLQEALELTHQKQKEVFFGLLSDDFLASLQPEYELT